MARRTSGPIELAIVHEIHCSAERFWELHLDAGWTRQMIAGSIGFSECRIDEIEVSESEIRRHMYVVPDLHLPKPVVKVLGDRFGYDEHGVLDRRESLWRWSHRLGVLSDRIVMGGSMRIEPVADDRCRRAARISIEADLFGIGGLIERAAERATRDGWDTSAHWINDWLMRNPE
jgi:hypothetical protein